jgi:hypothetical protein
MYIRFICLNCQFSLKGNKVVNLMFKILGVTGVTKCGSAVEAILVTLLFLIQMEKNIIICQHSLFSSL